MDATHLRHIENKASLCHPCHPSIIKGSACFLVYTIPCSWLLCRGSSMIGHTRSHLLMHRQSLWPAQQVLGEQRWMTTGPPLSFNSIVGETDTYTKTHIHTHTHTFCIKTWPDLYLRGHGVSKEKLAIYVGEEAKKGIVHRGFQLKDYLVLWFSSCAYLSAECHRKGGAGSS